jgi:hypothetical protein
MHFSGVATNPRERNLPFPGDDFESLVRVGRKTDRRAARRNGRSSFQEVDQVLAHNLRLLLMRPMTGAIH